MHVLVQKKNILKIIILSIAIGLILGMQPIYANQDEVLESQKESLNISDFIRQS